MDNINTEYLQRCVETLEKSYLMIKQPKRELLIMKCTETLLLKGLK